MSFKRSHLGIALAALTLLFHSSCAKAEATGTVTPKVAVSILPQAYFMERIAEGRFEPIVIVGPGQDPHSYEPSPSQLAEIGEAKAWFTIGVEFENALKPKIASLYKGIACIDAASNVRFRNLEAHHHEGEHAEEDAEAHEKGEEGGHDPHVWLGRQASKEIAASIAHGLSSLDPEGSAIYEKNLSAFVSEVDALFDALAADLAPHKGSSVLVFHPAFGYFLDDLGLRQVAVETGGKEPTQKALVAIIDEARREGATTVFVQAQFPTSAAETVARAIGGSVTPLDPLARDWMENLKRMGAALRAGFGR
jgi:zinc transport system substrate-binding protein